MVLFGRVWARIAVVCVASMGGFLLHPQDLRSDQHEDRLRGAFQTLLKTVSGQALVERAEKAWKLHGASQVLARFKWGSVSRTDAVLTREFNPETGEERRERKISIYLKREQTQSDLVLDMAHELTHAVARPAWDPYDPELTASQYLLAALEGPGGEIEALMAECQVALEVPRVTPLDITRCQRYQAGARGQKIERAKVWKDFYRVGKWRDELSQKLGKDADRFPFLSADAPVLISSTGNAPYPAALLKEFEEINEVACANSRRRLSSISSDRGRGPASELESVKSELLRFLITRCR